jgi:L-alanine-DL-glutamate epimerase-like enolase superfamily enzyme
MSSRPLKLKVVTQSWPLDQPFRIARGVRTEAHLLMVTLNQDGHRGNGEAVPCRRYGETIESSVAQLQHVAGSNERIDRELVQKLLPAGAARNALDCALWDLEAKVTGKRAWELANIEVANAVETSLTISLDTPEKMAASAKANAARPLLKLKLGGDALDLRRVEEVRQAAPAARLLVDANESWSASHYRDIAPALAGLEVELIEQPFPSDSDKILEELDHPVPVCADESVHTSADLPRIVRRYQAINVKLDKTGGLTEALTLTAQARQSGLRLLFGCMVCTSLGIAPARILAQSNDYVDLDGPLLLAGDRHHGLSYEAGKLDLPRRDLWG